MLHDGRGVVTIGPPVDAVDFFEGHYRLTAEEGDLDAMMFVADPAKIRSAATAVCAALPDATRKLACERVVAACRSPSACLSTSLSSESCGERIELDPSTLELEVYLSDSSGTLSLDPTANATRLLDGARLCGPAGNPSCPDRMPAVVITEREEFQCLAPARQLACEVSVDLTACGIGRLSGTFDDGGGLSGAFNTTACVLEALGASDVTAGGGPGFAIVCGARRLVATYSSSFPGTASCAVEGPSAYDASDTAGGVLSGLLPVDFRSRGKRLVMVGTGSDRCGFIGCNPQTINCGDDCRTCCAKGCEAAGLDRCIPGPLSSCGPSSSRRCVETCVDFCLDSSLCPGAYRGRAITVANPDVPFEDAHSDRVDLDFDTRPAMVATSFRGVINIAAAGMPPVLVVADRWKVLVYEEGAGSAPLSEIDTNNEPDVDFEIGGVMRHPTEPGLFYVFGTLLSQGQIIRASMRLDAGSTVASREKTVPELDTINAATVLGDTLYLASGTKTATAVNGPTKIVRLHAGDLSTLGAPWMIDGVVTHTSKLGPSLVVAFSRDGRDHIALLDPATGSATVTLPVIQGLSVSAMLADGDRVFVGYRKTSGITNTATGLVGVLESDGTAPVLRPPFAATVGDGVDILAKDVDRLYAVSGFANWITPIRLH